MSKDLPFLDEQPRRAAWIVPLLIGFVLGACVVTLVQANAELEHRAAQPALEDVHAEATEAVLWSVDVDGESAP